MLWIIVKTFSRLFGCNDEIFLIIKLDLRVTILLQRISLFLGKGFVISLSLIRKENCKALIEVVIGHISKSLSKLLELRLETIIAGLNFDFLISSEKG